MQQDAIDQREEHTAQTAADLLSFIADDRTVVAYRPRWNQLTGSITATILLQQLIYRWINNKRQPFYKFSHPCDHPLCRPGDSWEEELGLSRREFESARKAIAVRTQGDIAPDSLISYWMTTGHCTWYAINEPLLVQKLAALYPADQPAAVGVQLRLPAEPLHVSANGDGGNVQRHWRKRTTPLAETCNGSREPMAESANANGGNAQQIYKDDLKDDKEQRDLQDHTTAATPAPAELPSPSAAVAAAADVVAAAAESVTPAATPTPTDPRPAILRWIDFGDRLSNTEQAALNPPVLLAWAYWIHLEEATPTRPKNAIALARSQWRKGIRPRDDLLALARVWLSLDDDGRRAVLDGCQLEVQWGHAGGLFEGIDIPVAAALAVYRATAGELAPPSLTPPPTPPRPAPTIQPAELPPASDPPPAQTDDDRRLWKDALGELEMQMTRASYHNWLAGTTAALVGDELVVYCRNRFAVDWLANRLNGLVARTVASVAGRPLAVRYEVQPC
jgi:hypothetical protein